MEQVNAFLTYLATERGAARNTIDAYRNDLSGFKAFAVAYLNGAPSTLNEFDDAIIHAYIRSLETEHGYAPATVARKVAALKSFCSFLQVRSDPIFNPAVAIRSQRMRKPVPPALTTEQVEALLAAPLLRGTTHALRDAAILELMYATGLRVTELIALDLEHLQLAPAPGSVRCVGAGARERALPLNPRAVGALHRYLEVRRGWPRARSQAALFVSQSGQRLTRQGVWLVLRKNAQAAGIGESVSPQMLRHAFAAHAVRNGTDVGAVQELLGHASDSAARLYGHLVRARVG